MRPAPPLKRGRNHSRPDDVVPLLGRATVVTEERARLQAVRRASATAMRRQEELWAEAGGGAGGRVDAGSPNVHDGRDSAARSLCMGVYGGHFLLQGGEFQRFGNHRRLMPRGACGIEMRMGE